MRWTEKLPTLKPVLGQHRVIRKFILFPKKLEHEWRWLERASIKQIYTEWKEELDYDPNCDHMHEHGCGPATVTSYGWVDERWAN